VESQSGEFLRSQLKHEIPWKPIDVSFDGLVEIEGCHCIHRCQIGIQHDSRRRADEKHSVVEPKLGAGRYRLRIALRFAEAVDPPSSRLDPSASTRTDQADPPHSGERRVSKGEQQPSRLSNLNRAVPHERAQVHDLH